MKPEQIAKLRSMDNRPDRPCGTFDGTTYRLSMSAEIAREVDLALWSVPQLLDEREALLAAAKALWTQIGHCCGEYHDDALAEHVAAITKAES